MHSLEGLLEFVAVVDCGTFTAAARQLGVSVSHISRQIAGLESRLATQLFIRTTRQMQLTQPGRRLFDISQPLIQELLGAQDTLLATHEAIEGNLRISLAGKFAEDELVPLLTRFCVEHPQVQLDIDVSARNVDLLAEGFHLAVRMGPLQSSSSLVATRLLSLPMHVLASPKMLQSLPDIDSPADLPPEQCLSLGSRPWEFSKGKRRSGVKPAGRFSSNSGAAAIQAALDGLGIVSVPAYYAAGHVESGRLVRVLPDWTSTDESIFYLVFPATRHMPLRVRRLIEYLQEQQNRAV
ncbi:MULTISPECIES: LysR family transcriptional regulator [unclassified Acidovorax]|jgi:DNA-binding transcriptional LysR family regulator|uniref:LysR family transcriptional regulator n=1 Tax=unclassified Acidovorax TaxID=2684926 RepID=UPI000B400198|nr:MULTISPECIES: LysR family transcriptional regulator [unclassified Acidovorax]